MDLSRISFHRKYFWISAIILVTSFFVVGSQNAYAGNASITISKPGMAVDRWLDTAGGYDYIAGNGAIRIGNNDLVGFVKPVYHFDIPSLGQVSSLEIKIIATEYGNGTTDVQIANYPQAGYGSGILYKIYTAPANEIDGWIQGEGDGDVLTDYIEILFINSGYDDLKIYSIEVTVEYTNVTQSQADLLAKYQMLCNSYAIVKAYDESVSPKLSDLGVYTAQDIYEEGINKAIAVAQSVNELNGVGLYPSQWGSWASAVNDIISSLQATWNLWKATVDLIDQIAAGTAKSIVVGDIATEAEYLGNSVGPAVTALNNLALSWQAAIQNGGGIDENEYNNINPLITTAKTKLNNLQQALNAYSLEVWQPWSEYTSTREAYLQLTQPLSTYEGSISSKTLIHSVVNKYIVFLDEIYYAPTTHTLAVNSSGTSGVNISSSTGHNGTTPYAKTLVSGTSVTLTAPSSAGGKTFTGWTGSVSSSNQIISFTMSGSKTVTANYQQVGSESITLTATATDMILSHWPDNAQSGGTLDIYDNTSIGGFKGNGFVKFNLSSIPDGSTINSVELKMYCSSDYGNGKVNINRSLKTWSSSVTWNSYYSGTTVWNVLADRTDRGGADSWWVWNSSSYPQLKDCVQGWVYGNYSNYGFLITPGYMSSVNNTYGSDVFFYGVSTAIPSSSYPKLVVTYTPLLVTEKYVYAGTTFGEDYSNYQIINPRTSFIYPQDFDKICMAIRLEDVYKNGDYDPLIKVKAKYYRPNGSLHTTRTWGDVPKPNTWWSSYTAYSTSVATYGLENYPGRWTCRVYIDEGEGDGEELVDSVSFDIIRNYPSKTINPTPGNGSTGQSIGTNISWFNGGGATSYDVYFGTDSSPDSGEYKGNQTGASYDPGPLDYSTPYYWRIDPKNSAGTTTGDVWSFTTESAPVLPQINSLTTDSGPKGSYIKIEGTDFGSTEGNIDFSGTTSEEIVSWSNTEIYCRVPDIGITGIDPDLEDGLIAYYKLDESSGDVVDSQGSNTGINNGAIRGKTGVINNCFEFSGGLVDCGDDTSLNTPQVSVSVWFKTGINNNYQILMGKFSNETGVGWTIKLRNDGKIWFLIGSVRVSPEYVESTVTFSTDTWHHLVVTYDSNKLATIYLDNVERGSGILTKTINAPTVNLQLGNDESTVAEHYDGLMDEVRIYNRALSASEVQELYQEIGEQENIVVDDFESYPINTWPTEWDPDANANASGNGIVADPADTSNQVLRLFGSVGGCWGALAYKACELPMDYIFECDVYNGSESLSGCHPDRGGFGLRNGTYWSNPGRRFIVFKGNGDILGTDSTVLGTYNTEQWYHVKVHYERIGASLSMSYWIDGSFVGQIDITIDDLPREESLDHVELVVQEGSAYFDNFEVYTTAIVVSNKIAIINPDQHRILKCGTVINDDTYASLATGSHADGENILGDPTLWSGVGQQSDFIGSILESAGYSIDYYEASTMPAISTSDYGIVIVQDPLRTNVMQFDKAAVDAGNLPDLLEYTTDSSFLTKLDNYTNSGGNVVLVGDAVRLLENGTNRLNYGKTIDEVSPSNIVDQPSSWIPGQWLFTRGNPFCGRDRNGSGQYTVTSGELMAASTILANVSINNRSDLPYSHTWSDTVYKPSDAVSLLSVNFAGQGEYVLDGSICSPTVYYDTVDETISGFVGYTQHNGRKIYYLGSDSFFDYNFKDWTGAWHTGQSMEIDNTVTNEGKSLAVKLVEYIRTNANSSGTVSVQVIRSDGVASNSKSFTVTQPQTILVDLSNTSGIENGSTTYPFSTIQRGIDAASDGVEVIVAAGTYYETIDFLGKSISVESSNGRNTTVIDGGQAGSTISFVNGETAESIIEGFTITGGTGTSVVYGPSGGGIFCQNSSPTIINCLLTNNNVGSGSGGGIACYDCSPKIIGCEIFENSAQYGGGVYCVGNSAPVLYNTIISQNGTGLYGSGVYCDFDTSVSIENCTIVNNSNGVYCYVGGNASITNSILWNNGDDLYSCSATYSCVENNDGGIGNIHSDPLFVDPVNDYHLLPDSNCIDAGNPSSSWENEPSPNGARVNMGAYGNTPEATRSRADLQFVGFNVISRTRIGRTIFQYTLSLSLENISPADASNVTVNLIAVDDQVTNVIDDMINYGVIPSGSMVDSDSLGDYFVVEIDRAEELTPGRLTWQIDYSSNMQMMSLDLPAVLGEAGVTGDITGEGDVDMADLMRLAEKWLWVGTPGSIDEDIAPHPDGDGIVNFLDFALMAENWMN